MSRFRFELATPADDADLAFILAETPMPGHVAVSLRREPSWFDAAVVDGHFRQVVACRNLDSGRLVGFGCRSLRRLHVNGRPEVIGYLSSLRCLPAYRNQGLVARGYAFFRRLHQDGRTPFYLTTIAEGNKKALETLTSGRAGLPAYHLAGRYHTVALALGRKPGGSPNLSAGVMLRTPRAEDLPPLLDLLATVGPRRQFFPCYRREDFLSSEGALRGLTLSCLVLAERAGRPIGLLGGWDQSSYRQSVVHHYSGWVRGLRPVYNVWQWLQGRKPLPSPGQPLRCLNVALPLVADDDPAVFAALLTELRNRLAGGPWSHLLLGLHESDPLLPLARRLAAACYTTFLYLVSWPDGADRLRALDNRPMYLELGTL
jgi:hypothetical protein